MNMIGKGNEIVNSEKKMFCKIKFKKNPYLPFVS